MKETQKMRDKSTIWVEVFIIKVTLKLRVCIWEVVWSSEMGGYEDVEDLVGAEGGDGWRAKGIVA